MGASDICHTSRSAATGEAVDEVKLTQVGRLCCPVYAYVVQLIVKLKGRIRRIRFVH